MSSFELTSPSSESYSFSRVHFTSVSEHYGTPKVLYDALHAEFGFNLDPCPLGSSALFIPWNGKRVYCNPPYGPGIDKWLAKAGLAEVAVFLLPARTDTAWWHRYAPHASEVRFLRGRLKFNDGESNAPFPSVILVFR